MKQVLQSILDECRRVLPVDTLYVALYDPASDSYEIPLFFHRGEYRSIERRCCETLRSLTCEVIALRRALYIHNIEDPAAMGDHVAIRVAQAPVRTYLGVPMMLRERVVGVLSIQSLQADAYTSSDVRFLETIAMQAAIAVDNAQLYEAAQRELAERKQIEDQLRVMVAKYAALFDTAPVGISITDDQGHIVECNTEAEHLLGIAQSEHLLRTYDGPEWQIVRPDGTPMPASEYASVRAAEEQRRVDGIEMGIVHNDGSIRWISVNATPIPLEGQGVAIAYTDITERKRAEDELRQSEQRYRMLADNGRDAVWVRDLAGELTYASPSIARLWGYSREDFARHSPEGKALSAETMKAARQRADRMMVADGAHHPVPVERFDLPMRRKDGSHVLMDVLQSPLLDKDGTLTGFLFAGRDVTEARTMAGEIHSLNATLERRVAERTAELSAALDQLTLAARMKDEFLAAMSHELRTPLAGILGAADALAMEVRGPLTDHQKRQVRVVSESGERLLKMVNDLLRYAELVAGRSATLKERCSLAEIGSACVRRAMIAAARKQQQITLAITPPSLSIISDGEAITNMLDALLDNAAKFTPVQGHIALEIGADDAGGVRFVVSDDGIGIEAEKQTRIFLPFVQGDGALNRAYDGTGLGLAFVARMAQAMDGTVGVESSPTRGSCFIITVPTNL